MFNYRSRGQGSSWRFSLKKFLFALFGVFAVFALLLSPAEASVQHWNWWNLSPVHHVHHIKHIKHANYMRKHHGHHMPALPPIVVANINISSQSMSVKVNGWPEGYWKVSTARSGYHTPRGSYRAIRLARVYYSKKYDNSPMPNSVFFYGGFAIHGTGHISGLGHPDSHGCVRLHPSNAAAFYALVERYGMSRTRIVLTD
jgi:hypothetical protein